jgi:hypothetical protein
MDRVISEKPARVQNPELLTNPSGGDFEGLPRTVQRTLRCGATAYCRERAQRSVCAAQMPMQRHTSGLIHDAQIQNQKTFRNLRE